MDVDVKSFNELGSELTPHTDISLNIRNTAIEMFELVVKMIIKRGSPRVGLVGACIHLASIHWNYPITITEISKKINKKSSYITGELKGLRGLCGNYDIEITDEKYINRYFIDIKSKYNVPDEVRDKLLAVICRMNEEDIMINYHANTRICCLLYLILKNYINIPESEFCNICKISRNTHIKFVRAFEDYEYLLQ